MKRAISFLLSIMLPALGAAQSQLVSGYNFGQFLGAGDSATDAEVGLDSGFIGANWKEGTPPALSTRGDSFLNSPGFTNGTGAVYWNGTVGSTNNLDTYEVVAIANPAPSINAFTVNGANLALIGDHNGTNMALSVKGAYSIGFQQNMTGFFDAGGTDLTFAAQAATDPITIDWMFNSVVFATTTVGPAWTAYVVDLPEEFYGAISDLTAIFSGAGRLDNLQFNGSSTPLVAALTFWKGGAGTWTAATSPANWRDSVGGTEEGVWAGGEATFGGTADTVTVDDTDGPVTFTGIKFLSDGYVIEGDALTTTTAATAIQVDPALTSTISSVITGTGGLDKTAAGTLVLSGANTYTGATLVTAGTLRINGDQSAATGAVTVKTGGTLSGTGALTGKTGGIVTVENGGTLAGATGSLFTMPGLILNPTSTLSVGLGAPGTTKLFQVNGNLTLDGLLDVSPALGFGNGVYRLIDVTGGTITNNVLSIGDVLGNPSDYVITTTASEVNVTVTSTSLFWEGTGTTWSAGAGSTGWTNAGGGATVWAPNFAIFRGTAGTVTVDSSPDPVEFTGMQFAVTGYTVAGEGLTTSTANARVGVGAGEDTDTGVTATISAPISGTGGINKTSLGTLVLAGTNTYAGGTTVSEGTLQLGAGGTAGSITGNVTNNATLAFNRSDAATFAGNITGTGSVVKDGTNTLTLTGTNTYGGGTTVNAGTLSGNATGLQGNITNNAAVVFDLSAAGTYGGDMGGTGTLTKQGTGTLSLTGANTLSGTTTVSAGTLSLGAGGTAGSLAGNIVNNATLALNRSDALTVAGNITGTGAVTKLGAGTTILSGTNTYAGATTISAGKLLINGNQSAATGAITVGSGATLGGSGTAGGTVTVANGGILAGASGATLTMPGLILGASSIVDVSLGAPGSTTSLFQVNGNLTLDGLLNITAAPAYGDGLYRLFNFTGTLTDNGLSVGSVPGSASGYSIKTDTANQVSVMVAASALPQAWVGGTGTWSASTTGTGWGDTDGKWQTGKALFDGTGGTVTVDSSTTTPVVVTGVQFAVDEYVIAGKALTTNTANTAFRVGDGTADSAFMTATISAPIVGTGGVDKTDLGTLVLASTASTYTGGTRISSGVLEVADDKSLGASSGALRLNGGTLRAGAALTSARAVTLSAGGGTVDTGANNVTLSGVISGTGALVKQGTGKLTVSGNNTFSGATTISAGAIALGGTAGSLGATTVATGARLEGAGSIRGNLTNHGTLSPGASPGTITVTGNLTQSATGNYVAELASATSHDKLLVTGTANLAGSLTVTGLAGFVPGTNDRFKIIEATGGRTGTFTTVISPWSQVSAMRSFEAFYGANDVSVGFLQKPFAGLEGTPNQVALGAAVDAALAANKIPVLANTLNALPTEAGVRAAMAELSPQRYERWFDQAVHSTSALVRTAETRLADKKGDAPGEAQAGLWMETVRRQTTFSAQDESTAAKGTTNGIIVGGDIPLSARVQAGVFFGYTDEGLELDQAGSSTAVERFTGAAYLRYESARGFVESVAGASYSTQDGHRTVDLPAGGGLAEGSTDGRDLFASVRTGFHLPVGSAKLTPYLALQHVAWSVGELAESGVGDAALTVHAQKASSLASRVGFTAAMPFKGKNVTVTPRLDLAWRFEFRDEARELTAELGEAEFTLLTKLPSRSGFIGSLGLDASWKKGTSAYARVTTERNTSADKAFDARAGMDFRF